MALSTVNQQPAQIAAKAPIILAADSWEAEMVRRARRLHAAGRPAMLQVRLGDCHPNFWRVTPDGKPE